MVSVGVTGGIGAGKSLICKIIGHLGYPVYYADEQAARLLNSDPLLISRISERFGPDILDSLGKPDRGKLAALVFGDSGALADLNAIVHPAVEQDHASWLRENAGASICFSEAALYFETGRYRSFDKTILVVAPVEIKLERLRRRSGMTEEEARKRMDSQWSDTQKMALADFIIHNDEQASVIRQVLETIRYIRNQ